MREREEGVFCGYKCSCWALGEKLGCYLIGKLDKEEAELVRSHMLECERCFKAATLFAEAKKEARGFGSMGRKDFS
jgi:hypothetical protein